MADDRLTREQGPEKHLRNNFQSKTVTQQGSVFPSQPSQEMNFVHH